MILINWINTLFSRYPKLTAFSIEIYAHLNYFIKNFDNSLMSHFIKQCIITNQWFLVLCKLQSSFPIKFLIRFLLKSYELLWWYIIVSRLINPDALSSLPKIIHLVVMTAQHPLEIKIEINPLFSKVSWVIVTIPLS